MCSPLLLRPVEPVWCWCCDQSQAPAVQGRYQRSGLHATLSPGPQIKTHPPVACFHPRPAHQPSADKRSSPLSPPPPPPSPPSFSPPPTSPVRLPLSQAGVKAHTDKPGAVKRGGGEGGGRGGGERGKEGWRKRRNGYCAFQMDGK